VVGARRPCRIADRCHRIACLPALKPRFATPTANRRSALIFCPPVIRYLKRYGLITGSLAVLFGSGIAAGYRWGRSGGPSDRGLTSNGHAEATPEQWSESAAVALQRDLGLTDGQTDSIRRSLGGPSQQIFDDRRKANLKIHLRLLELHDNLAREMDLSDKQKTILLRRREQLRDLIMEKFRDLIGDKPDSILSGL